MKVCGSDRSLQHSITGLHILSDCNAFFIARVTNAQPALTPITNRGELDHFNTISLDVPIMKPVSLKHVR